MTASRSCAVIPASYPPEVRLPLPQKCRHSLTMVGGTTGHLLEMCLVRQYLVKRGMQPVVDGAFGKPVASRGTRRQLRRQRPRLRDEVVIRHDAIDQTQPQGLPRIDRL